MADTVKTRVMKALEAVLRAGVPEVKSVHRREPVATDLETIKLPGLFLYENPDEHRVKGNRFDFGVIPVEVAVFIRLSPSSKDPGFQAFYDLADTIAARVSMVLWGHPALKGLVTKWEEDPRHKAIGNESFGELVLRYRITYGHAAGDAFTTRV